MIRILKAGKSDIRTALNILSKQRISEERRWNIESIFDSMLSYNNLTHNIYKATIDNKVAGFIEFRKKPKNGTLWISNMAILPQYQRKGIGRILVGCVIEYAKLLGNVKKVRLYPWEEEFFRKLGFRRYGYDVVYKLNPLFPFVI